MKNNSKIYWYGLSSEPLSESDGNGNFTDDYIFFAGSRVAHHTRTANHLYHYLQDHLGTSRTMVTSTGTVCYDADFSPFGGELPVTISCGQNYKFTGKERDPETSNDDFGARSYSSNFGRFMSADWSAVPVPVPYANLTNPQTLNLYAMARDNPMTFADLDGHRTNDAWDDTTGETGVDAIGAGGTDPTGDGGDNGAQAGGTGSSAVGGAGAPANIQPTQNQTITLPANESERNLTVVTFNETGGLTPSTKSGDGSATNLHDARVAIAEVSNRVIEGGHPNRVALGEIQTGLWKRLNDKNSAAIEAWNDSLSAVKTALARSNSTKGAANFRVDAKTGKVPAFAKGKTPSQTFGSFRNAGGGDVASQPRIYVYQ